MIPVMSRITLLPSPEITGRPDLVNVEKSERIASVIAGVAVVGYGIVRRSGITPLLLLLGGMLIHRATTGRCPAYQRLGRGRVRTNEGSGISDGEGFRIEKAIIIDRAPAQVFNYWRDLENLPRFMPHLRSVKVLSNGISHWAVDGPVGPVEWDAEIINEHPGSLLAWQTLPGAEVRSAGTVRFESVDGGHRTKVSVVMQFQPPIGSLGAVVARIFGESPGQRLGEDLVRFKLLLETESDSLASVPG